MKMVEVKINGKWPILLPEHRAARPEWYTKEGWERKRLDHMHKHIGKGDVVFYVGSEESEMPALCQMWGAEVVLFEPNPKVWPNAKAIWGANNLEFPMALFEGFASNETSKDAFNNIYTHTWMPHAEEKVIGNHGFKELYLESVNYPQIRISEIVGYGGIEYPSIISLDVEGSEWQVLRGAESILNSHKKPLIYLSLHSEFLFHQWGEYSSDLRRWLMNFGYVEELIDYAMHETHLLYKPQGYVGA